MNVSEKMNVSKGTNRRYWIAGIAALLLILLLLSAPASNRINSGSTWGNAPDGYSAWYAYMEEQGATIKRWQRPLAELIEQDLEQDLPEGKSATLLQVIPSATANPLSSGLEDWLNQGNTLITLAQRQAVTAAPFTSQLDASAGKVTIETRRRYRPNNDDADEDNLGDYQEIRDLQSSVQSTLTTDLLLADEYGAVVWQSSAEAGRQILSTTPFLAANAYQDAPGNFAFLADLVTQTGGPIWVDEYLHGYKDSDVVVEEVAGSWIGYLAKTPLLILAVQAGAILLVGLVAQNRRIGRARSLFTPKINNSEAYIKALAGVLHKANNHDFLVETLVRAEQKSLQRALGLGAALVSQSTLRAAWQQSTGRSEADLNVMQARPRSDSALHTWLRQLQALRLAASNRASQSSKIPDSPETPKKTTPKKTTPKKTT